MTARLALLTAAVLLVGITAGPARADEIITFNYSLGLTGSAGNTSSFQIQLFDNQAPLTVANFLHYLNSHLYDNTFISRYVPGFVMQQGGYTMTNGSIAGNTNYGPVQNEFSPTRSNVRGTIAMAKLGGDPNSASDEWFVNLADNSSNLDSQNGGFTVFGQVTGTSMGYCDAVGNTNNMTIVNAGSPFDSIPLYISGTNEYVDLVTAAGTGGYSLTLNNSGNPSPINVTTSGQWIDVPVVVYNDLQIDTTTNASGSGVASLTVTGAISQVGGARKLTKTGTGLLTLTATNNSYSGGTTLSGGTLDFVKGALGTAGAITFGGGILQYATGNTQDLSSRFATLTTTANIDTNGNNVSFASGLTGPGGLTKFGAGTLTLSASSGYSGGTIVSGGTLQLGNLTALGASTGRLSVYDASVNLNGYGPTIGALSGNSGAVITDASSGAGTTTLTVNTSGASTFAGAINSGSAKNLALTKSGSGVLTLTGTNNTYSGNTTVNGGTLKAMILSSTGSTTVAAGALLQVNALKQHQLTVAAGGKVVLGGVSAPATGALAANMAGSYADVAPTAGTSAVPEPGMCVLMTSGALCLLLLLRRRKRLAG